jgi:hypothetical protein
MKHSRIGGAPAHQAARQVEQDLRHGQGPGGQATPAQGHHRGYAFRPGRAPAAPPGRRAGPLRPRARPRAAQGGQIEQEEDRDLDIGREADETAIADKRQAGAARETDDGHHGAAQDEAAKQARPWTLKPPGPRPAPAEALDNWLAQHCGASADALLKPPSHRNADHAGALADALAATWVAALREPVPGGGAAPSVAALQGHALRAYLRSGANGALATVAAVKQLLLRHVEKGQFAPGGEPQQDRRLLLPLALLNADRPRTPRQSGEACERLALAFLPMAARR